VEWGLLSSANDRLERQLDAVGVVDRDASQSADLRRRRFASFDVPGRGGRTFAARYAQPDDLLGGYNRICLRDVCLRLEDCRRPQYWRLAMNSSLVRYWLISACLLAAFY